MPTTDESKSEISRLLQELVRDAVQLELEQIAAEDAAITFREREGTRKSNRMNQFRSSERK